ncbi:MAG: cytochrome c maturation protein CcmE [Bacteroidetes bacterium]|nr:cytochrome c maturation protein CcmE [Bacteroidota bacterium]
MKKRYMIGGAIIVAFLIVGGLSFLNSSIEYATLGKAEESGKRVQVTGTWVEDMSTHYDTENNRFTFFMRDEDNRIARVELTGAKPNNFDIATSVVAKGRFEDGVFKANEVLTKCPSKYEGNPDGEHPEGIQQTSF